MTQSVPVSPAGAKEGSGSLSREVVLGFLNAALATELLSLVRCKRRYYSSEPVSEALREEFLEQAIEESMHTDRIVGRIIELGGLPDFSAQGVADFSADITKELELREVINEELVAQRLAIDSYRNIVRLIGAADPTTCAVLEDVIRRDQQYIDRLARYLGDLPKTRSASRA
jgi:bacterioferritin